MWAALEAKIEEISTDATTGSDTVNDAIAERGGAAAVRADAMADIALDAAARRGVVHDLSWRIEGTPGVNMVFVAPRGEHAIVEPTKTTDPGAIPRRHRRARLKPRLECNWDRTGPDYHDLAASLRSRSVAL